MRHETRTNIERHDTTKEQYASLLGLVAGYSNRSCVGWPSGPETSAMWTYQSPKAPPPVKRISLRTGATSNSTIATWPGLTSSWTGAWVSS